MHDSDDWARRLNPPRRNHFFYGKMMGIAQFEREQRYGMGQRWLMNRLTLGTGILCGLGVQVISDGRRLCISPGVAVDPWGREIVVARSVEYDPFAAAEGCGCSEQQAISQAGVYTLCLSYRECTTDQQPVSYSDDCPGQPECQPDTTIETFSLGLRSTPVPAKAFDCDAWMGDAGLEGTTLTSAILRTRLAQQFATGCGQPPADPCVPLGLVTVTEVDNGIFRLTVVNDPRVYIHSQAQLLDALLCLAETVARCCGTTHTDPTDDDTLKVTELGFWRVETGPPMAVFPPKLVSALRVPDSTPPVFIAKGSPLFGSSSSWDPLLIRISFNKPLDGASVFSYPEKRPVGFVVTVAELDTPPPQPGQEVEASPVYAFLENANVMLMTCPGDPGSYKLTLRGDPVVPTDPKEPTLPAIFSWDLDPAKRRRLDGELSTPPTFPSGNQIDGGDFIYAFEIRHVSDTTFKILKIELLVNEQDDVPLVQRTGTVLESASGLRVTFNGPVDMTSVRKAMFVNNAHIDGADVSDDGPNAFIYNKQLDGHYEVKLSSSIMDVPLPGKNARGLDGEAHQPDPPLPSGSEQGDGDFVFNFQVGS